ncbi:hypothetical protein DFH06DRAFT_1238066, partial [Mycena polygramma]
MFFRIPQIRASNQRRSLALTFWALPLIHRTQPRRALAQCAVNSCMSSLPSWSRRSSNVKHLSRTDAYTQPAQEELGGYKCPLTQDSSETYQADRRALAWRACLRCM